MPSWMRAPPESLMPIIGEPGRTARSITLQIFSAITSPSDPPSTVKSCENKKTWRPSIVAWPVTTPSPRNERSSSPNAVVRCTAKRSSSTNDPGSTSASTRSRAVRLPRARCFASASSPAGASDSSRMASRRWYARSCGDSAVDMAPSVRVRGRGVRRQHLGPGRASCARDRTASRRLCRARRRPSRPRPPADHPVAARVPACRRHHAPRRDRRGRCAGRARAGGDPAAVAARSRRLPGVVDAHRRQRGDQRAAPRRRRRAARRGPHGARLRGCARGAARRSARARHAAALAARPDRVAVRRRSVEPRDRARAGRALRYDPLPARVGPPPSRCRTRSGGASVRGVRMTSDSLADRVRTAVDAFAVPALPAALIAARIASAPHVVKPNRRRPAIAIAGGVTLLAVALAVAGPQHDKWLTPAQQATLKRLAGQDFSHTRISANDVPRMTLAEARRYTKFPIVVPRGKRVLDARPYPNDAGATLLIAVDVHAQAQLDERWVGGKRSALATKLEGVGIHDDGSIRRFTVRRWRIRRIQFSMPMFTPAYHRYAQEVERATREAAAEASKPPG